MTDLVKAEGTINSSLASDENLKTAKHPQGREEIFEKTTDDGDDDASEINEDCEDKVKQEVAKDESEECDSFSVKEELEIVKEKAIPLENVQSEVETPENVQLEVETPETDLRLT